MFTLFRRVLPIFILSLMVLSSFFASTSAYANPVESNLVDVTQKIVSLILDDVPDDTVQTAVDFVQAASDKPEQRAELFAQIGNFFVKIGQGKDAQEAALEIVRSHPELAKWHDLHGGEPQSALFIILIIIIIIIIILVCWPKSAH